MKINRTSFYAATKRYGSLMLFSALFLAVTISPAFAGKLTINKHDDKHWYAIKFESWLVGSKRDVCRCLHDGAIGTDTIDWVIDAIGKISVYRFERWEPSSCRSCKYDNPTKEFQPPGAYLPHRTFTVTIEKDGSIKITEP